MTSHHFLSLEEKISLINDYANGAGLSQRKLCEKYKVSKRAVYNILQGKEEYSADFQVNANKGVKRKLHDEYGQRIDEEVFSWFAKQRSKYIPISGPLLQEKARQISEEIGIPPEMFKASNGWLAKFKNRHGIVYRALCDESASVDSTTVEEWKNRLSILIDSYSMDNVYNADETGLCFKLLPDQSMALSRDSCKGGKRSKERYTVLLCSNWSGSHRLKPLVIGKSRRPRCFKDVNISKLPITWRWNCTAWMNATIFTEWINSFNVQIKRENRQILLFLDNASVHPVDLKLSNITVVFFPPNTTSIVQPLDQGIIRAFKVHYRSRLVKRIISRCEVVSTSDRVIITTLDAVHWIAAAWNNVTQPTIVNTFRKAGFQRSHLSDSVVDNENETTADESIKKLDSLLSHVKINDHQLSAAEYATLDDEVPVFNEWDDSTEIAVIMQEAEQESEEDGDYEHDDEAVREAPPSFIDALGMIQKLHLLVSVRQPELHSLITDLESKLTDSYIESKTSKQSSIMDFFPRI